MLTETNTCHVAVDKAFQSLRPVGSESRASFPRSSRFNNLRCLKSSETDGHWRRLKRRSMVSDAAFELTVTQVVVDKPVYIFEDSASQNSYHVIWFPSGTDLAGYYRGIDSQTWQELTSNQDVPHLLSQTLIACYLEALDFFDWKQESCPFGFVIIGNDNFGFEVGNVLGIRVSVKNISLLWQSLKNHNQDEVENEIKAIIGSIIHELVHRERDETPNGGVSSEIASHVFQFLFRLGIGNTDKFNHDLASFLDRQQRDDSASHDRKILDKKDIYTIAQYKALVIIAYSLAKVDKAFLGVITEDSSYYKINALKNMHRYINQHLHEVVSFLSRLMTNGEEATLWQEAKNFFKLP